MYILRRTNFCKFGWCGLLQDAINWPSNVYLILFVTLLRELNYWLDIEAIGAFFQSRWQRRGKRSRTLIKKFIFFIQRCHILASAYCMWAVFSSNLNQLPLGCQLSLTRKFWWFHVEFYAVVTFHLVRVDPSRTTILKLNVAVWLLALFASVVCPKIIEWFLCLKKSIRQAHCFPVMKFFGYVNFFVIFCSLVVWMNNLKSVLLSFDGLGFAKFA